MGDQQADREEYFSGEEYRGLKGKLAKLDTETPTRPIARMISDAKARTDAGEHDTGANSKDPAR